VPPVIVLDTPEASLQWTHAQRDAGRTVGLVPTQGGLHEGHGALINAARSDNDTVALTLFVNPLQFRWDKYLAYPRNRDGDLAFARTRGVDAVYVPDVDAVYPELHACGGDDQHSTMRSIHAEAHRTSDTVDRVAPGFQRVPVATAASTLQLTVVPERLALRMDGEHHAWHFDAVATVVERLYLAVPSDRVYYGSKDVQQAAILDALGPWLRTTDESMTIPAMRRIGVHRDQHGVSMSSRHMLLDAAGRDAARGIAKVMLDAARIIERSGADVASLLDDLRAQATAHGGRVEYLDLVDSTTLEPVRALHAPAVLYMAFWIGDLRLAEIAELACHG
jgi:pantothenate synthetase